MVPSDTAPTTDCLMEAAYPALRRLAESRLRSLPPGLTMQATAVVHEAWMDLRGDGIRQWDGPGHFQAVAASAIRDVVVDAARRRSRIRRGGDRRRVPIDAVDLATPGLPDDPDAIVHLDAALRELEDVAADPAAVVRLRWFGGMSHAMIAAVLDVSERTVERRWRFARAWLATRLDELDTVDGGAGP